LSYILSKSSYLKGLQCPKALYLYKHYYTLKDPVSPEQQAIFNRGHEIGKLAQQLFPGGIDVTPASPKFYKQALQKTTALIGSGQAIIYEAGLVGLNTLVYCDILVKNGNGYDLYEVKSSLKLSKTYYQDIAIQFSVAKASGLYINKAYLININANYILEDTLNLTKLFTITDCTDYCKDQEEGIKEKIGELIKLLQQTQIPKIEIGPHCNSPYSCDFKGTCWKTVPEDSILYLNGIDSDFLHTMQLNGINRISEIEDVSTLKDHLKIQIESRQTNKAFIEIEKIKQFINDLRFPLTFFDIESAMPAVPKYKGTHPFHLLPGIFSSITLYDTKLTNEYVWIHETNDDPRENFILAFLKAIPKEGDLLVYDIVSEKNIIKKLISDFPKYKEELDGIMLRMKDIAKPFSEKWYYHPEFKGGYSLKSVCKHVLNSDLFSNLNIKNGIIAMHAYEKLPYESDLFERARIMEDLKEYSLADVRALIMLYSFFKQI
jgi:hypothetical protein